MDENWERGMVERLKERAGAKPSRLVLVDQSRKKRLLLVLTVSLLLQSGIRIQMAKDRE